MMQLHVVKAMCLFCLFVFETGPFFVALAGLELIMKTRLAQNSQRSTRLCSQSIGIKGVQCHHPDSMCLLIGRTRKITEIIPNHSQREEAKLHLTMMKMAARGTGTLVQKGVRLRSRQRHSEFDKGAGYTAQR